MSTSISRVLETIAVAGVAGAFLIDLYIVVTAMWIFRTATAHSLFLWDASNLLRPAAFQH
jgi:hypothetical protein